MLAEFASQDKILIVFPSKKSDWICCIKEAQESFANYINALAKYQLTVVLSDNIKLAKTYIPNTKNIKFVNIKTNDTWIRDYGVISIKKNNQVVKQDFIFNGWGNKYKANLDNKVNKKLFKTKKIDFILEGGSVDSNGDGIILATLKSLVDKNRNNLSKKQMEKKLKQYLNIDKILWLKYGYLLGDDTDGHIDTLARFVDKKTIIYAKC